MKNERSMRQKELEEIVFSLNMTHAEKARALFLNGFNCAQATYCAFCDVTGSTLGEAMRLSSSFGGGMGRMRLTCGAISGGLMVLGVLFGYDDISSDAPKAEHYARVQEFASRFRERHTTLSCSELLADLSPDTSPTPTPRTSDFYKSRPCADFISDAAEIIDQMINETLRSRK